MITLAPPRSIQQLRAWLDRYRDWRLRLAEFDGFSTSTGMSQTGIIPGGSHSDRVESEILRRDVLHQRVRAIDSGLARLELQHRVLLQMRYMQQLSISRICRETRFSRGQVFGLLREAVRELFLEMGGADDDAMSQIAAGLDSTGIALDRPDVRDSGPLDKPDVRDSGTLDRQGARNPESQA